MAQTVFDLTRINPLRRPSVPKVNLSKKLGKLIEIVNNRVLPNFVIVADILERLLMVIYCTVTAIASQGSYIMVPHKLNTLSNELRMLP